MAHMWLLEPCEGGAAGSDAPGWALQPLEDVAYALSGRRPVPVPPGAGWDTAHPALLLRRPADGGEVWFLVGSGASVNGVPLGAGIRVLQDRDELRVGGRRAFFSSERLAVVEPFPGAERPIYCPRCKLAIEPGSLAVRCPGQCQLWHHQQTAQQPSDALECWTYSSTCSQCDQPSALDAGYRWTPGAL